MRTVDKGNENCDDSQNPIDIEKEYYQRRKERTMMTKRRVYAFQEDPYDFVYENIRMEHRILKAQNPCVYCGAKRLQYEFRTFCCMSGKTKLTHSPIPTELHQLFTRQEQLEESFRYNTRRIPARCAETPI
uniref:Uncharacterized protein n=1 Tax=Lactuca sativa TaxID=4236 RepID=A0A9R1UI63_LACSA|nr:hypothetical protein LSAT_V11C900491030 [Lactuca sativa]